MENSEHSVYVDGVCVWCIHKENCTHDKYVITELLDRITMRCSNYEYNRPPEQYVSNKNI